MQLFEMHGMGKVKTGAKDRLDKVELQFLSFNLKFVERTTLVFIRTIL